MAFLDKEGLIYHHYVSRSPKSWRLPGYIILLLAHVLVSSLLWPLTLLAAPGCPLSHPFPFDYGSLCNKIGAQANFATDSTCQNAKLSWGTPGACGISNNVMQCPNGGPCNKKYNSGSGEWFSLVLNNLMSIGGFLISPWSECVLSLIL